MKKIVFILIALAVSACMADFDPEESTSAGVTLSVDLMPIITDLMRIDEEFFAGGRITDEYAEARLRVRTYCYDSEDRLVEKQASSFSDFNQPATFRFSCLERATEYTFVAVADFFLMGDYGAEEDVWYHILAGSSQSMYFKRVDISEGYLDIIGYASCRAHPSNATIPLSLTHLGAPCKIEFLNAGEVTQIYSQFTGLSSFSPTGDTTHEQKATFYWTYVLEESYELLYDGIYIIPPASGESELTFMITRSDQNSPLNTSATIDVSPGTHLKIQIDCQNGQIKCTEI